MTVRVTDHALVRFIERVADIDLTIIRDEISDRVIEAMDAGAGKITIDDFVYVLEPKNRSVVTVMTKEQYNIMGAKRISRLRKK